MNSDQKGRFRITELINLNLILILKEKKQIINTTSFQIFTSSKNVYEMKVEQSKSDDQLFQGQVQLIEKAIDHLFLNVKDLSIKQHNIISIHIPIDQEQMITNRKVVLKLNENSIERLMKIQNTFEIDQWLDAILGIQSQFRGRLTARNQGQTNQIDNETIRLTETQQKFEQQLRSQIREIENTEQQLKQFKEFFNHSNQSQEQEKTSLINCLVQQDQTIMNILQSQWRKSETILNCFKIKSSIDKFTNNIETLIKEIKNIDSQIQQEQVNFNKKTIQLQLKDQILERLTYKIECLKKINPLVLNKIEFLTKMNKEIVTCERYFEQNYNETNKEQLQIIQNLKTLCLEACENTNHFLEILNFNNDLKLQQELEIFKKKEKDNQMYQTKLEQQIQQLQDELEKQKKRAIDLENQLNCLYKQIEDQKKQLQQNKQKNQDNLSQQQNESDQTKNKLAEEVASLKYSLQSQQVDNKINNNKLEQKITLLQNELEKKQNQEKENKITKTNLEQQMQLVSSELEKYKNNAKDLENQLNRLNQQIGQIEAQNKQLLHINQDNQDKLILTQNDVDQSKSKLKVAEDEVVSLRYQLYSQQEKKFGDSKLGKISNIQYHFNNQRLTLYDQVINQKQFSIFSINIVKKSLSEKSYFGICDKNITNAEFVQFLNDKESPQKQIYIIFSLEGERLNNFQEVISQVSPITKFLPGQNAVVIFDPSVSTLTIYKSQNELEVFSFSLPSIEKQFVPCFIHSDFDETKQIAPQYMNFEI
ncbi:unnamed protein product (macronuclear) [Paramecium tetraurelia]|uniref:PH domain-containing protein n=1 Tax=Paramecium tetraurelia TaxID=5888 RepID=A0EF47_PARTE|nr:uncharacterized protein GSPATT00026261001 [Paramecium tetraurelia]CAK93938.1 unnamed protein product [Paramecium tetraurelia]|eukprot:XP_001461311.1 hypothetical protein (macronuclear) [Paramecium tetraurelia strain d4-2]